MLEDHLLPILRDTKALPPSERQLAVPRVPHRDQWALTEQLRRLTTSAWIDVALTINTSR